MQVIAVHHHHMAIAADSAIWQVEVLGYSVHRLDPVDGTDAVRQRMRPTAPTSMEPLLGSAVSNDLNRFTSKFLRPTRKIMRLGSVELGLAFGRLFIASKTCCVAKRTWMLSVRN